MISEGLEKIRSSKHPPKIMVVDDEEMVTKTLATYLQLETDYDVLTFQSPAEALERLKEHPVDLIISDFLMPEMDGLEFLTEAKRLYPEVARILLTGYADKENAIKAINDVGLYQYIEKPWDNDRLRLIIRNGLTTKNLKEVLNEKIRELDNVLLERDQLFEHNEMLKSELMLARNVQESLLPQALPDMNGLSMVAKYLPALEIGGDFYDAMPLANGKTAVMIADVTGHGIQAALITVLLKAALAEFKDQNVQPGEILTLMNKVLYEVLPENLYVAALIAVIEPDTATCRIVNGGIPNPYHLKHRDGTVERIPASGLLLGIASEADYQRGEEVVLHLEKNDKLIFYTDGLSEVPDPHDNRFEVQIKDVLQESRKQHSTNILEHLLQSAREFSKDEHTWDDVTIVGIEHR